MQLSNKISCIGLILAFCCLQNSYGQEAFRVMFYNVENLYDTIPNPAVEDNDFTPDGNLHWNSYRYFKKIDAVAKVISNLGGKYPPAIVGLCEVENKNVMDDLVHRSLLAKHKYRYLITNSKDHRGSNVALMYQRDQFKLIAKRNISLKFRGDNPISSRDILHVTGMVVSGDTIDIFVCHFPSRSGGEKKTDPYRIQAAQQLKNHIEKLSQHRACPNILVMGDFNDYPTSPSIQEELGVSLPFNTPSPKSNTLYGAFIGVDPSEIASYKFRNKWGFLDHFVVNGNLLINSMLHIIDRKAYVYSPDFLLDYDEKYGGKKPFRTYSGWTYLGGASDHLPIYLDLFIKE